MRQCPQMVAKYRQCSCVMHPSAFAWKRSSPVVTHYFRACRHHPHHLVSLGAGAVSSRHLVYWGEGLMSWVMTIRFADQHPFSSAKFLREFPRDQKRSGTLPFLFLVVLLTRHRCRARHPSSVSHHFGSSLRPYTPDTGGYCPRRSSRK